MGLGTSVHGEKEAPLLVCVHGLMGGPQDFDQMVEGWKDKFHVIVLDLLSDYRDQGIIKLSQEGASKVTFSGATEDIQEYLVNAFPGRSAYFNGISLGGKVVYDFAAKFPQLFLGGVVTDVGPGLIEDSDLYHFVEVVIPSINLNLPWPELKADIKEKIPEKNIRIMVQTQAYYPDRVPPAQWKPGIENLQGMLSGTSIKEQWYVLDELARHKARIIVLNAEFLSGTSHKDLERMRPCPSLDVRRIPAATHFLHITHRAEVVAATLELLGSSARE